jgi:two-component system, chemotaxis family, response regulator Rcp1
MNDRDDMRTLEILLVEDNPGDVDLTKAALRRGKLTNRLTVATDGEEALTILRRGEGYADAPRPDVILLDLNLPKKSGVEVLSEIKQDSSLKRIPVVVMTSSKAEEDVIRTYDLHANCYVTKPVDLEQFRHVVKSISEFWFALVRLPSSEPAETACNV